MNNKTNNPVYYFKANDATAEVSSKGILIWLFSQGSQVEVGASSELQEEWLSEINRIKEHLRSLNESLACRSKASTTS